MLFPERCSGMVIFHWSPFRARREGLKRERSAEEADVLRDTCPRTPGPVLARPLWRTLHRAAGDRDDAALGDAAGSGRAAWSAPTDRPARSDPALAGNEPGAGRCEGSRTRLKTPVSFSEKRLESGSKSRLRKSARRTHNTLFYDL